MISLFGGHIHANAGRELKHFSWRFESEAHLTDFRIVANSGNTVFAIWMLSFRYRPICLSDTDFLAVIALMLLQRGVNTVHAVYMAPRWTLASMTLACLMNLNGPGKPGVGQRRMSQYLSRMRRALRWGMPCMAGCQESFWT